MSDIGKSERATQNRVIALFLDELRYRLLGDWSDRVNRQIDEGLLRDWLANRGHTPEQIGRTLDLLGHEAHNPTRSLYDNNRAVYSLLRYGADVKLAAGENTKKIWLIDWQNPEANDFAIAEEVTLTGAHERRPDLVLYVNGLAVGVIELKRSAVSIGDGIRQLISNQQPEFNAWFFSTVQVVFAGNDAEGLRYGTIGTPEKMFLAWKEDEADNTRYKLDKYLLKICAKARLIELMRDFVLFDGGVKKLPRVHQYFGVKAAQQHARDYRGGIIWHTQGSGKSIVMVLLARWILENLPHARVLVVTDREELDAQIERVFHEGGETIHRTQSGDDLMAQLGQAKPRLLCSLVHKFGRPGVADFDAFIKELKQRPSPAVGELFIFVDECHRTQSGRLHKTMKALLPGAVFIGFTGTPLLRADLQTSREVFGSYIHTYQFGEAVEDGVVLDLVYEARDVPQELGTQDKIDQWFEAKTKGLNDWQKAALREQWGTMQKVLSSRSRMERVVEDIVFDFNVRPRLASQRGTALLVASSIYEACRYFELFEKMEFKGRCAVVTSYNPQAGDVTKEDTGANTETEKEFLYNTYTALLKGVVPRPGKTKTETYEAEAKEKFRTQPANMRLLIVVDKLLTGFDAPLLHVPVHRQVDAGPWPVPGHLPDQPARRRRQAVRLHRRLQGPVPEGSRGDGCLHVRARHERGQRQPRDPVAGPTEGWPCQAGGGPRGADPSVRAGPAAQGRVAAYPLLLRQHRESRRSGAARAAARGALQGRGGAGSRVCVPLGQPLGGGLLPGGDDVHRGGPDARSCPAAGDPAGERRDARSQGVRSRHAPPDRYLYQGGRGADDFGTSVTWACST